MRTTGVNGFGCAPAKSAGCAQARPAWDGIVLNCRGGDGGSRQFRPLPPRLYPSAFVRKIRGDENHDWRTE